MRARLLGFRPGILRQAGSLPESLTPFDFLLPCYGRQPGRRTAATAIKTTLEEYEVDENGAGPSTPRRTSPKRLGKKKAEEAAPDQATVETEGHAGPVDIEQSLSATEISALFPQERRQHLSRVDGYEERGGTTHQDSRLALHAPSFQDGPGRSEGTDNVPWHRSFVHKQLLKPDPPSPSVIREHLRQDPSLATDSAVETLLRYAVRTGQSKLAGSLRRMRVVRDRAVSDGKGRAVDLETSHDNFKLSRWARKAWPPKVCRGEVRTVAQAMSELHYHLAMGAYNGAEIPALSDTLDAVTRLCQTEGRGDRGIEDALRGAVHLYIAYSGTTSLPQTGHEVWNQFEALRPDIRPSRQTLHVLVHSIIWPISEQSSKTWGFKPRLHELLSDQPLPTFTQDELAQLSPDIPLHLQPIRPEPFHRPSTIIALLKTISTFHARYQVFPRPTTYRHILQYALSTDQPQLGHVAYEGWWLARATVTHTRKSEGDAALFRHQGMELTKWRNLLKWQEIRYAWAKRVPKEEWRGEDGLRRKWRWCVAKLGDPRRFEGSEGGVGDFGVRSQEDVQVANARDRDKAVQAVQQSEEAASIQ